MRAPPLSLHRNRSRCACLRCRCSRQARLPPVCRLWAAAAAAAAIAPLPPSSPKTVRLLCSTPYPHLWPFKVAHVWPAELPSVLINYFHRYCPTTVCLSSQYLWGPPPDVLCGLAEAYEHHRCRFVAAVAAALAFAAAAPAKIA